MASRQQGRNPGRIDVVEVLRAQHLDTKRVRPDRSGQDGIAVMREQHDYAAAHLGREVDRTGIVADRDTRAGAQASQLEQAGAAGQVERRSDPGGERRI